MNTTDHAAQVTGTNIVAFRFQLAQRVTIEAIETRGRVVEMSINAVGREYRVAYFDDDKVRRIEWFYEDELC